MEHTDRVAVVVMAKSPRPGAVKTRLAPALGMSGAAELAACFLGDTLDLMARLACATPLVAYAPEAERGFFETLGIALVPQRGRDLGSRLVGVFDDVFQLGFPAAMVGGVDTPTLPPEYLEQAISLLTDGRADAVIGPTEDGGYYLLGLRALHPELFEGVAWGSSRVFSQTMSRAAAIGIRVATLPTWHDVDTPADLERLALELDGLAHAQSPRTSRWLTARRGTGRPAAPASDLGGLRCSEPSWPCASGARPRTRSATACSDSSNGCASTGR